MKTLTKHHLTEHARQRLAERTSLTEEQFLDLADNRSALVYRADASIQYEMIWSSKDRNGYVLTVQPDTGIIVTIKRVLKQSGFPCDMHDSRKAARAGHEGEAGVANVTSAMLEQAVLASGADISEAQEILAVLAKYEEEAAPVRTWNYRWTVRFLHNRGDKVTSKVANVGSAVEVMDQPPADIIEAATREVSEASGWDASLNLVSRDDMSVVGEWNLADLGVVAKAGA